MKKIASVLLILLILSSCGSPPPFFNRQPFQPSNPFPANGASNVSVDVTLSWGCGDPDGDTLRYDIYFGKDPIPPLAVKDHPTNSWNPGILSYNTTYYWKIVAKDGKGGVTEGPVWSFTTQGMPQHTLTVTTSPETGLVIKIDGVSYTSPKSLEVEEGNHTIEVVTPQYKDNSTRVLGDDTRYEFDEWD
ncbi:MAG: PEGA domain-containing protein, partial [Thermotogaceae bacterium]|nr:PEGA domain-containing protein [Thermotogaceae bacterium]